MIVATEGATQSQEATACVEWGGCYGTDGYGVVTRNRKSVRAHRYVWAENFGPIPAGMWVLHRCDNPHCVNPAHLFLGSPKDNIQDCIKKGRRNNPHGSSHHNSKLTDAAVRFIRSAEGSLHRSTLGFLFGVSPELIWNVQKRRIWKHVQ